MSEAKPTLDDARLDDGSTAVFPGLARGLAALERRGRRRGLARRAGLDFASNDYLGLSNAPILKAAVATALADTALPLGSGGSRLLRGNHELHEALENEAARHFRTEAALFFAGGFPANAAIFSTLPQRGDLVVHDALIHASVHDGLAQTKAAVLSAPHNDADAIDGALRVWRKTAPATATPWIAVESLYSMDGDFAPLDALAAIADRHGAVLVIDEAHATGVLGPVGRGLAADLEGNPNVITLHTCGKALGVMGGLVCAPKIVTEYLVNRARGFIYATAPPPVVCAAVLAALDLVRNDASLREALAARTGHASRRLEEALGFDPSPSHIKPIVLGREQDAITVAEALQAEGFDVRAIRPPTVPDGTARLRLSLTLNVCDDDITALIEALAGHLGRLGLEARRP